MIDDRDVWRAADLLATRHGSDAALTAALHADELLIRDDVEGHAVWRRILGAVAELTRNTLAPGEWVN